MQIAMIGAGRVGTTLGPRLAGAGHAVTYGVRDPARAGAQPARTVADAVAGADVVVLATPWQAALELARTIDLAGRVVIDATNPLGPDRALALGHDTSGAEQLQAAAPAARVVKAFNTIGSAGMAAPAYPGGVATMPVAGDDPEACRIAAALAADVGFSPVVLGPLRLARALEPMAALWIDLAYRRGLGPDFALAIVARGGAR